MKYIVAAFLAMSCPVAACQSAPYQKCIGAATTEMAMNTCANAEAMRTDGELNMTYHKLLLETKNQQSAVVKIREMERSWIKYRDQFMTAMYPAQDKQAEYGSMYPMEANLLRVELTRDHVAELKLLLKQYGQNNR